MIPGLFPKVTIPPEWTGDQAKAVWEFLEELSAQIWQLHEEGILQAAQKRNSTTHEIHEPTEDANLPF